MLNIHRSPNLPKLSSLQTYWHPVKLSATWVRPGPSPQPPAPSPQPPAPGPQPAQPAQPAQPSSQAIGKPSHIPAKTSAQQPAQPSTQFPKSGFSKKTWSKLSIKSFGQNILVKAFRSKRLGKPAGNFGRHAISQRRSKLSVKTFRSKLVGTQTLNNFY